VRFRARRSWLLAACAAAAAICIPACGGSSGSKANGRNGERDNSLTVAVFPSTDYAALYLALKQNIFKKEGLNVKAEQLLSGPDLTAALVSGKVGIAASSSTSGATGISHGLPTKMICAADYVPTSGYAGVLVSKGSGITSFADLSGKTVDTQNLEGLFQLGVFNAIQKQGGDPKTVKALAVESTDAAAALGANRVQAITLQDPFLDTARANPKFESLGNPFRLLGYSIISGAWFATDQTLAKDPSVMTKFCRGITRASKEMQANPALARQIIPQFTSLKAKQANAITLPVFTTVVKRASVDDMLSQMKSYGWLTKTPSYSDVVWNGH
jgi:NitT/TauT family transport system substrate-binding protein